MFRVNATWNSILAACHNAGTPNFDKKMQKDVCHSMDIAIQFSLSKAEGLLL